MNTISLPPAVYYTILCVAAIATAIPVLVFAWNLVRAVTYRGRVKMTITGSDGREYSALVDPSDQESVRRFLDKVRRLRECDETVVYPDLDHHTGAT